MMAAVVGVPQKIVLNSATSISLNDRFTNLARLELPPLIQTIRIKHQENIKNTRLAQQMFNRPGVKIERDTGTWANESPAKGNLAGRLGRPNIHNRLGLPMARGRGGRVPWWSRGRGAAAIVDNGYFTSPTNAAGVGQFRGSRGAGRVPGRYMFISPGYRGGYGARGGVIVGRGVSRGGWFAAGRGRGISRGQLAFNGQRGRGVNLTAYRGRGGRGFASATSTAWRGQQRGGAYAPRGAGYPTWIRGRGRGRGGMAVTPVTQQQLDNQIDDYMSKTRLTFDAFV